MITQERLKELLDYDPATGVFRWKVSRKKRGGCTMPGDVAGCLNSAGYVQFELDQVSAYGHRLAWLYLHGSVSKYVDHRDGNKSNNAEHNLRDATMSQNLANRGKQRNNSVGFKGVTRSGNKFTAQIHVYGKRIYLGNYQTPELAHAAYADAATRHFGEYARAA